MGLWIILLVGELGVFFFSLPFDVTGLYADWSHFLVQMVFGEQVSSSQVRMPVITAQMCQFGLFSFANDVVTVYHLDSVLKLQCESVSLYVSISCQLGEMYT